ncbi:MAG: alkaline phosphatase [Planctomycetota bacterium]
MKRRDSVLVLLGAALLFACAGCGIFGGDDDGGTEAPKPEKPAKNVILLIGDGMGPSQVTLGRLAGPGVHEGLAMEKTTYVGLVKTYSTNALVTDSAAAGTAYSTGRKTKNHVLGLGPDGTNLEVLAEWCHKKEKAVGLVTTTSVTHATPAAFTAHCEDRGSEKLIAEHYLKTEVDLFFGGGLVYFPEALQKQFRDKGWSFLRNRADFLDCREGRVIGLFADRHMDYEVDRDASVQPSLEEMTQKALQLLHDKESGFFLMIEGGRIDMACHGHDAAAMVKDLVAFDKAVEAALAFAERDGNTLVLVTADHATAGLAITEKVAIDRLRARTMSAEKMGQLVGEGKRPLADVVREHAGFEVSDEMLAQIEELRKKVETVPGASDDAKRYALQNAIGHILSQSSGVQFIPVEVQATHVITKGHDGCDVSIYAWGPHAGDFTGVLDNTDVGARIRRAMEAGK